MQTGQLKLELIDSRFQIFYSIHPWFRFMAHKYSQSLFNVLFIASSVTLQYFHFLFCFVLFFFFFWGGGVHLFIHSMGQRVSFYNFLQVLLFSSFNCINRGQFYKVYAHFLFYHHKYMLQIHGGQEFQDFPILSG
jgi:hypothetical protein